ncbi:MAG: hypothetical protein IKL84_07960 [Clostridia bacterium]|nr:hypothetical protein [Clostridia bacterium]
MISIKKNSWICAILFLFLAWSGAGCTDNTVTEPEQQKTEETADMDIASGNSVLETEPSQSSEVIPEQRHTFEYDSVTYDLREICSELQGVFEWSRIGKYVMVQGYVDSNTNIFAVINTETKTIEHHFTGTAFTCHSDDINTIVYAHDNTIKSFDGTPIANPVLRAGECVRKLAYTDDKTQLAVTIETPDSMQTKTIDLKPIVERAETQIEFNDVVKAYHSATEAASWFRIAGLLEDGSQGAVVLSDRVIEKDLTYFKVNQFQSYSEFMDYLGTLFGDDLIESFLACNGTMYINHNGYLYGRFGMRGTNIFIGEETYKIEQIDDKKIHLLVTAEILEKDLSTVKEYQTFLFPYENRDGKWVFTDFPEIR